MTTLQPSARPAWLNAVGGFLLGCALLFLIRAIGIALLPGACQGRTLLGLLPPLLLGPGGIAVATTAISRGRSPALGIGLAIASLFPALAVGVRDISELRTVGCAGGYVVFGTPSGGRQPEVTLRPGQTAEITLRPGGFQPGLGPVTLSAQYPPVLSGVISSPSLAPGATATLRLSAASTAPGQQYTVTVKARQGERGADGQLTVTIRPRGAP